MTVIEMIKEEMKSVKNLTIVLETGSHEICHCCHANFTGNRYHFMQNNIPRDVALCTSCMSAYAGGTEARHLMELYGAIKTEAD